MSFGFAWSLDRWLQSFAALQSLTIRLLAMYLFVIVIHLAVSFPLSFYAGHVLEHQYQLSRQSFRAWLWRYLKLNLLTLILGIVVVLGLYWMIWLTGPTWWLWAAAGYFLLVILLGQLGPVLIQPLFHKIERLEDESLKSRLEAISAGTGLSIEGVYRMRMSEETVKANAYLAGLGATRRVILGDTLLEGFSPEEIDIVFAHEIGHHVHRHTLKLIAAGVVFSLAGFFICDRCLALWMGQFAGGLDYRHLPVYALPFLLLVIQLFTLAVEPLQNAISRFFERQSDTYALQRTGHFDAYRSFFVKLARLNKADLNPPVWEVVLWHSHPPIAQRLALADGLEWVSLGRQRS
jgi:STE24 endopeptidase